MMSNQARTWDCSPWPWCWPWPLVCPRAPAPCTSPRATCPPRLCSGLGRGLPPLCGLGPHQDPAAGPGIRRAPSSSWPWRGAYRLRPQRPEAPQRLSASSSHPTGTGLGAISVRPRPHGGAGTHRPAVSGPAAGPRGADHPGGQHLQHGHRRTPGELGGVAGLRGPPGEPARLRLSRRRPGGPVHLLRHQPPAGPGPPQPHRRRGRERRWNFWGSSPSPRSPWPSSRGWSPRRRCWPWSSAPSPSCGC